MAQPEEPAVTSDTFLDDIEYQAMLSPPADLKKAGNKESGSPYRYKDTKERMTMVAIVVVGAFLIIPLAWSQAQNFVIQALTIISMILVLASRIMVEVLGGSLILYPLAIVILVQALLTWMNRFTQANKILFKENGLVIRWPWGQSATLPWTDITSIFLIKPTNTMLPEQWLVGFGLALNVPVSIKFPVVTAVGEHLLELMQKHCRWTSIDPDLIESFEPAKSEDSHTELWLKSLSRAPKEAELMPLFPGSLLKDSRYLVINRIGVGGQGTAYLACDKTCNREVVIKENLFPVFVDAEVRVEAEKRFNQEVDLLGRLNHDNIVRLIDFFTEDHRGYLVMEYIDGLSLRKRVNQEGPLSEEEVRDLSLHMAKILEYLHSLEPPIVHRDFTPENLILDKNHRIVLIDFNVARQLVSTKTATVVGKHAYIPPEQFRGETDARSDIYAFGATLHFLLTGSDPEPISQSHPAQVNSSISKFMDTLVARSTAENAQERFQSAAEILCELNKSTAELPESEK